MKRAIVIVLSPLWIPTVACILVVMFAMGGCFAASHICISVMRDLK